MLQNFNVGICTNFLRYLIFFPVHYILVFIIIYLEQSGQVRLNSLLFLSLEGLVSLCRAEHSCVATFSSCASAHLSSAASFCLLGSSTNFLVKRSGSFSPPLLLSIPFFFLLTVLFYLKSDISTGTAKTNESPGLRLSFDWQLNLCQPVLHRFFIPDTINVALSCKSGHLISIFFCVLHNISVCFANSVICTLVINT